MYAWDIAVAANKLNILNQGPPVTPLISQPPHDRALGNASMYHYTWGSIYKVSVNPGNMSCRPSCQLQWGGASVAGPR